MPSVTFVKVVGSLCDNSEYPMQNIFPRMASYTARRHNAQTSESILTQEDHLLAFESLKECLTKLDHSPQNFKASVGRSGTHGKRRPPSRSSRANSIISSKSSTESVECIDVDKEATLVHPKVVTIDIHLEGSEEVLPKIKQTYTESGLTHKLHSRVSGAALDTNKNFKQEPQINCEQYTPPISPILLRLLGKSKSYRQRYNYSDDNILSIPSLTRSTSLKRSDTSASLSALDLNRSNSVSKNTEDFFDSQSHHSDSYLSSIVLLRNILNNFKNKNNPSSSHASSSDTEVVISDRESLSDSGEINRRTVIHITAKNKTNSSITETTDNNNNCKEDSYSDSNVHQSPQQFHGTDTRTNKPLSNIGNLTNVYEKKSRMFVRQSDSSNRPSRASAFNVRQTIEKRQNQQERRERRALRKKLRAQLRSSSTGRPDSDSTSLSSSEASNISKSLSSLDENEDSISNSDPLIKVHSSPTLESDKSPIRTYLFGTNLTTEPNSRSISEEIINHIRSDSHERSRGKENINSFANRILLETPAAPYTNARNSVSDTSINHTPFYTNPRFQYSGSEDSVVAEKGNCRKSALENITNNIALGTSAEEYSPVPPPRRRSRISSSAGQLTVEKIENATWLRQAKERRSLRNERRPFDDLPRKAESIVPPEPQWIGKARKKLESMNVYLTSTTDTVSVSSVISDSSAWSRGGLDALEDLKEEVGRMSDVLSEEALQKIESDLGITYKERNMIEYPSIPENPNEPQTYAITANDMHGKDEVRFGDLKHDWGGIKYERKLHPKHVHHSPEKIGKENHNSRCNSNISSKYPYIKEEKKVQKPDKLKLTHFGDCPQDVVSKQSVNLGNQKSSKFESIRGPDPLTMSVDQLNQNVEEYDFPVPTGKEDSQALLKILEQSLKRDETVPEFTSDLENEPKPKSILKRRSNQGKKNTSHFTTDEHILGKEYSFPAKSAQRSDCLRRSIESIDNEVLHSINPTCDNSCLKDHSKKQYASGDRNHYSNDTNSIRRPKKSEKLLKIKDIQPQTKFCYPLKLEQRSPIVEDYSNRRNDRIDLVAFPNTSAVMHQSPREDNGIPKETFDDTIDSLYAHKHSVNRENKLKSRNNYINANEKHDNILQSSKRNSHNHKLSDWEEIQRQRLDTEERNKANRGTFIKPISDKIKDLIRSHAGIKNVFGKDNKNNQGGTVDATEILYQKIPSSDSKYSTSQRPKVSGNSERITVKSMSTHKPYKKYEERETSNGARENFPVSNVTSEIGAYKSPKTSRPLSTYIFSLPESSTQSAPFKRFSPLNKSLGSSSGKRNIDLYPKKITGSLSSAPLGYLNERINDVTKNEVRDSIPCTDKLNLLSLGNRNSVYRKSYPAYKLSPKPQNDHTKADYDKQEIIYSNIDRLQNKKSYSNVDRQKCINISNMYPNKKETSPKYQYLHQNVDPISKCKKQNENETTKENICPNTGNYKSKYARNKNTIAEDIDSSSDYFPDTFSSPKESSFDRFGSDRRSMTRVQNIRDRKYSQFERCTSPLSDKSYMLDRNRSGSPFSRISWSSRDRRHSLRSASSLRSTPDRDGPVSLSSILGRDTCSPYSSSNRLSTCDELGRPSSRYRKEYTDRESSVGTNYSDNDQIYTYPQSLYISPKVTNARRESLKRKSSDIQSSSGRSPNTITTNKQIKSYLSPRKSPMSSVAKSSRIPENSAHLLQKKDYNKSRDRRITKESIDKLATPKSVVACSKKQAVRRFDSNVSARSDREEEMEYYENINAKDGEGWSKTKIKKTKLGRQSRDKRSLSRENSGASSNSRHIKKASAELEKWAAQTKTSGKLLSKEGQRYSHEVEEEEKGGKKSAKAISRRVVRKGSRRLGKGGEIVSETKEITKDIPSKPPKAVYTSESSDHYPTTSLTSYAPKDDVTRKLKTKTDGERFTTTSVKTVKGINTRTTEGVDNKTTKTTEVIGGKGWEGEREVAGRRGERVVVERHVGKGVRPSTVVKKASSNSKIITTKTKMKPLFI